MILVYFEMCILIENGFVDVIKEVFLEVEVIVGIVIVGIFYGVIIVDKMNLLFVYICSKLKDYGVGN